MGQIILFNKWVITFSIKKIKTNESEMIDEITHQFYLKDKLSAVKMIMRNYDIGLRKAKEIADNIIQIEYDADNRMRKILLIKTKKEIKAFLKIKLYKYYRK